ncbi:dienelactone hydrolase family protein [Mycobacterium sp. MYCO198283]|uniref:dienelactone hydrolase family protein n=1 Tax=Mycobacterium sp. MYCO198283 TaxID=2883505 RepID=UPI001E546613|nr:dienelactone hydrolase family protein [Mycobacterium sp. MYCO198283]MCG5433331.1 dienelactone hydrolase family protein [Mycobacterium sp. MYCO198283]
MVVTREVTYDVDGMTMVAYLARPDGEGPWPSVLIGHDGIGLDDYQRGRADDLAERGYLTFAMDYHAGRTFFGDPHAMLARVMPLMADPARMRAIGRAALDVLLAAPGADRHRLAALGYGAGGRIVLELASAGVPFKALAAIHPGLPAARTDDWMHVGGAFLLCTDSEDPLCTPGQLFTFTNALQEAGIDWRAYVTAEPSTLSGPPPSGPTAH